MTPIKLTLRISAPSGATICGFGNQEAMGHRNLQAMKPKGDLFPSHQGIMNLRKDE